MPLSPEQQELDKNVASSHWQAPVEELSLLVLKNLLGKHDAKGAGSLASACQSWHGAICGADDIWREAVINRWPVLMHELGELEAAGQAMSWLCGDSGGTAAEGCAWLGVYSHWSRMVETAVREALSLIHIEPENQTEGGGSQRRNLWAPPANPQIDFVAWSRALEVLSKARLGAQDVLLHLLSSKSPLVNLLGVHYLIAKANDVPGAVLIPDIASLVSSSGCGEKRVTVRWWELGTLMFGAGWRTQDQMRTAGGCIGDLVLQPHVWKILLRGQQMEVRRIIIEDDS